MSDILKLEILIVDDIKDNLLALRSLLARDDVTIFQAQSGMEALELMMKHDFCIALLDVQMPGMNGFELAELMRGTNKTKNIPIIFVTAAPKDEKYDFKGYESGAVDFLRKPLDPHSVKSKVNVFLELHQQKRILQQQVEELGQIRIELEQAVRLREEFMSIAGHELRTPLTSLLLQSQLRKRVLKKGGEASQYSQEKLAKMFEGDTAQLEKLTRLIDDMLDVSRINSGNLKMNFETFDLGAMMIDLLERNFDQLRIGEYQLNLESCENLKGHWDKIRIEQVVTNLLTNAMRYGSGKPIDIKVSALPEGALIVIRDHGIGIAKDDLKRIFERFERATDTEVSGLGLGLYIVSQIIVAHQGSIEVTSEVGEGSQFTIKLPYNQKMKEELIFN